ncbi:hypothetical protein ACFPM3_23890 [Streptomyces coeruleoprunus]|uniref:Uncharacterized protein n=1 Tax=Streptomyces coeruleoprunus TaxID=285563 RepID=A0ABV9XKD4_9ACTN
MTPETPALPNLGEVRQDTALAIALAGHGRAHGELVAALRQRLCGYIRDMAPTVRDWAALLPDESRRAQVVTTVGQAMEIAEGRHKGLSDPAEALRLIARGADILARFTSSATQGIVR